MRAWQAALLALIAGVIGLATGGRPIEVAALALFVVLGIGAAYRKLQVGDIRSERRIADSVIPWGSDFTQQITITNESPLGVPALRISDQSTLPDHPHGYVTSLKAKRAITWDVAVPCQSRGRYRLGPVEAHMSDPLGFFPVRRLLGTSSSVLVLPRWVTLKRCALKLDGFMVGEARGKRRGESPPTVTSVREYTNGDSVSSIHWPASARAGQLMTKVFDPQVQTTVFLALDLDGELSHDVEELLVTATTSLAMYALHQANLRVGLITSGSLGVVVPAERGKPHQYRMQEALAEVHAGTESHLSDQLARADRSLAAGRVVILVTSRGPDTWAGWIHQMRRKGVAMRVVGVYGAGVGGGSADSQTARDRWPVPSVELPVGLADPARERQLVNYLEAQGSSGDSE